MLEMPKLIKAWKKVCNSSGSDWISMFTVELTFCRWARETGPSSRNKRTSAVGRKGLSVATYRALYIHHVILCKRHLHEERAAHFGPRCSHDHPPRLFDVMDRTVALLAAPKMLQSRNKHEYLPFIFSHHQTLGLPNANCPVQSWRFL